MWKSKALDGQVKSQKSKVKSSLEQGFQAS